jgi:tRNA(Ile)-lysidine synthase
MLLEKMKECIAGHGMLKKGDRVVVGVSGGPDSTALLYLLNSIRKEFRLSLIVAHLNHMIRKGPAKRDAEFVRKISERLGLPAATESKDIPKLAKRNRLSIEEAARNSRYDFYLSAAKSYNANKIALGHTMNDQAETVLMRLVRGSGLLGLGGIPPVRKINGKLIIRPLIDISKAEILNFLKARRIAFRRDETNIKPFYLRNKVRLKVLPFLRKEFNPAIEKTLAQTGRSLRLDYDYLARTAAGKFKRYAKSTKGRVELQPGFRREDTAIQRLIIRECIKGVKGDLNSITYGHWEDLNRLLEKKMRWSMTLPGGVMARFTGDRLIFAKKTSAEIQEPPRMIYELEIPGKTVIPEIGRAIEAGFVKVAPDFKNKRSRYEEYFDFSRLKRPIYARFRKTGDTMRPLGMGPAKRLKNIFVDEKVALDDRPRTPLLVCGRKIIWVCGVKRSDEAKVSKKTKKILKVKIRSDYEVQ